MSIHDVNTKDVVFNALNLFKKNKVVIHVECIFYLNITFLKCSLFRGIFICTEKHLIFTNKSKKNNRHTIFLDSISYDYKERGISGAVSAIVVET